MKILFPENEKKKFSVSIYNFHTSNIFVKSNSYFHAFSTVSTSSGEFVINVQLSILIQSQFLNIFSIIPKIMILIS